MKCPERYNVVQSNIRKQLTNDDGVVVGEIHLLCENQNFAECLKDNCAAWDNENHKCRKVGN